MLLATVPLKQLDTDYQTAAGTTLWGPTLGDVAERGPHGHHARMPARPTARAADEYIPVSPRCASPASNRA